MLQHIQLKKSILLLIVFFIFLNKEGVSQSYFANGNARSIGGDCYQLTSAVNWQLGSVWYADPIDLSKDFDLEFYLNFGNKDQSGADGIVFVLQDVGNKALGNSGGGLGFEGFSPSFGIEFDDFENNNMGDLASDHIGIFKNGSVTHTSANSISAPVSALPSGGNIEDGKDHLVRIVWDANKKQIEVWFDCNLRQQITYDIQNSIFNGKNIVYWGFTSSTGGLNNKQTVCLREDILVQDTFTLCKGETILLNARESKNNKYTWTPNSFLNDHTIRKPTCSSEVPMTYYVTYTDLCDNIFQDTVYVEIAESFTMDSITDSLLCDGLGYAFDFTSMYDSLLWESGSKNKKVTWTSAGEYSLRVWKGICYDEDTFNITTNTSPSILMEGDTVFCEGDSTLISIDVQPDDATYQWGDGLSSKSRFYKSTQLVEVQAENECNTVVDYYQIRELIIENLYLGEDTLLCLGDTFTLFPKLTDQFDFSWNTGSTASSIKIDKAGRYTLSIGKNDLCFESDTIDVFTLNSPKLSQLDDVLICRNEEIIVTVDEILADITWNNSVNGYSYSLKNYDGIVVVKAENSCGEDSANFDVKLIDCLCDLVFPNAFTPNQDNLNDFFKPTVDCPKLFSYNLKIYNRWGELVYQTNDITDSWDGTFKNIPCQDGVYFWISDWSGIDNGLKQAKFSKGSLHLIK